MFVIEIPYLSLERLAGTRQGLRWRKISDPAEFKNIIDSHAKYIIPVGDKVIKVEQKKQRFAFSCNDEEFFAMWYNYFDVGFDYEAFVGLVGRNTNSGDPLRIAMWKGKNLRILKHDLLETIITQVLIEGKTIEQAKVLVSNFCLMFGEKHKQSMLESGRVVWYGFPDVERLSKIEYEDLEGLGLGDKQDSFYQIIRDIVDGELDLIHLMSLSYDEALEYLMSFGIKKLTAKYICLYGLGFKNCFPIPREIKDKIEKDWKCHPYDFVDWELSPYDETKGIIYQYLEFDINWQGGHDELIG